MKNMIHHNHIEVISGVQGCFDIWKSITVIHYTNSKKYGHLYSCIKVV